MANEENKTAAQELTVDQMKKVFGDSGTQRYSGFFQEEPNTQWRDEQRIDNVEEMRRTDAPVKAVLSAMKAPVMAAEWFVEGEDEEIEEFVKENLFGMERQWKDFLRESWAFLDFGHYVFEIIWKLEDGVRLADLAPRIPRSIQDWQTQDKKRGITQRIRTDEHDESQVDIPIEKLLVLTNDKEGDDVTGISVLRSAYKHYKYKDILYRIQGIAAERYGVGVPIAYMPENFGTAEKDKMEEALKNLRSNEKNYLLIPWPKESGEVEILTPNGNPQGSQINDAIQHHNKMILMSVLATFLGLGTDSTGSFALSKDQSSFFLKHVEDKANYFAEQITEQVIKRLVHINFGEKAEVPKLKFTALGDIDFKEMSEVLKTISEAGLIHVDGKMKQFAHKTFKLPELSDEDAAKAEEEEKEDKKQKQEFIKKKNEKLTEGECGSCLLREQEFKLFRKLTVQEMRSDFKFLNDQFNEIETALENELIEDTQKETENFTKKLEKKLKTDDIVGIGALILFMRNRTRKNIENAVKKSYEAGKQTASIEMEVDTPGTPLKQTRIQNLEARELSDAYVFEIEKGAKSTIRNGVAAGAATVAIVAATRDKMTSDASKMITNISGSVVGQYLNRGRRQVFEENISRISKFQRSEVLDGRTCNMCLSLDGRVVRADDPIANMDLVHTSCRGVWVPIFVSDEQPKFNPMPKTVTDSFDTIDGRPVINNFKQLKRPFNKANKEASEEIKKRLEKK